MFTGGFFDFLSRLIRIASIVAVAFIVAGLIGFLTDEVRNTSTVNASINASPIPGQTAPTTTVSVDFTQPDPPASVEHLREQQHTSAREFIDDVGDVLMRPFTWIASGSKPWVQRVLYSALALLLYGLLGQVLADVLRTESDGSRRAAFAERERAAAEERRRTGTYVSPS
jgi:hypothetical protein